MSNLDELVPKFLVFKNVLSLVRDRGFTVPPEMEKFLQYNDVDHLGLFLEFLENSRAIDQGVVQMNRLSHYFYHTLPDGNQVGLGVYFTGPLQNGMKEVSKAIIGNVTTIFDTMPQIVQHVLVNPAKLSTDAKSQLQKYEAMYRVTSFMEDELYHNPTEHFLTPPHERLNLDVPSEREAFLTSMNLTSANALPKMETTCPIAKWYGFVEGDIIRAVRDCGGMGLTCQYITSYRQVTAP